MGLQWSLSRKLGAAFAVLALLAALVGVTSIVTFQDIVREKDQVLEVYVPLSSDAHALMVQRWKAGATIRGYLVTKEYDRYRRQLDEVERDTAQLLESLGHRVVSEDGRRNLRTVSTAARAYLDEVNKLLEFAHRGGSEKEVLEMNSGVMRQRGDALVEVVRQFMEREDGLLREAKASAAAASVRARLLISGVALSAVTAAILLALLLTRQLTQQIGGAVGQVQSASTQLQASAATMVTGAREQATATTEIATTIHEVLATSKQIAIGAQRVAQIAERSSSTAVLGSETMNKTHTAVEAIRREVEQIVVHMLELGRKSQQIGGVVDIVSELAEQSSILAINAMIEAAGAGEGGRRFAVVAEELRKLADRVTGSTKEIRGLIDDVRSSVNTTVMATEAGAKAVDAGTKQFGEVASAFQSIGQGVATCAEAAREIELSTKQQASGMEQVTVAISEIASVSKQSETSTLELRQTAQQLARLSTELLTILRPDGRVA